MSRRPPASLAIGLLFRGPALGMTAYVHQAIEGPHDESDRPLCHEIGVRSTAAQANVPALIECPSPVTYRDVERECPVPALRCCVSVIPRTPPQLR